MDALLVLTNIAIVFVLGLLCSLLSKKLKLSNVLFLVVLGIILGEIMNGAKPFFDFSPTFLVGIGILALVMIVFDGSSRFRFKELDNLSISSLRLIGYFMLFSIIIITLFTTLLFFDGFSVINILFAIMFAVVVVGTDPGSVFAMLKDLVSEKAKKVISILQLEAIFNTPVIVLLPFIILDLIKAIELGGGVFSSFVKYLPSFMGQIIIGIGSGVLVGLFVFKAMRNAYSSQFSPVAIITASLLSYVLAENIGGNGVLAVATLGVMFGNVYLKEKNQLQEFNYMLSNALEILVFVMVGIMIKIPFTLEFILKSLVLFGLLAVARMLSVFLTLKKMDYSFKEKLFITLNMPKGIAVAVVAFSFSLYSSPQMSIILNLIIAFMLYSLILSSIIDRMSKRFISVNVQNSEILQDAHPKLKNIKDEVKIPEQKTGEDQNQTINIKNTIAKPQQKRAKRKSSNKKVVVPKSNISLKIKKEEPVNNNNNNSTEKKK